MRSFFYDDKGNIYEYDDYKLISLNLPNNQKETLEYDELLRIKGYSYGANYHKAYRYLLINDHFSNLIESEYFSINNKEEILTYEYNDYGNIVKIKENDEEIVRYVYDSNLRLKREDNKKLNKTIIYSYDKEGNIIALNKSLIRIN